MTQIAAQEASRLPDGHPYMLAEDVSIDFLKYQLDNALVLDEGELHPEERLIHLGWAHTEMGLSPDTSDKEAEGHFEQAGLVADDIIGKGYEGFRTYRSIHEAFLLRAYLPALSARRLREPLTENIEDKVLDRLCNEFDALSAVEFRDPNELIGHLAKLSVHAAHLRDTSNEAFRGVIHPHLLYPGSARESRHKDSPLAPFNHDAYVVLDDLKIPYRIRSTKKNPGIEYDEELLFIPYSRIAKAALRSFDIEIKNGEPVIMVADLLADEIEGKNLSEAEVGALDHITNYLVTEGLAYIATHSLLE